MRPHLPRVVRVSPFHLRRQLTAALTEPGCGWVKVYDAEGHLIAEIDPVSRRRIPIPLNRRSR